MKYSLGLFSFFLFSFFVQAQNGIKVYYDVVIEKDEILEKSIEEGNTYWHLQSYRNAIEDAGECKFELIQKDTISEFYLSKDLNKSVSEDKNFKYHGSFNSSGYSGIIYQTPSMVYVYNEFHKLFSYETFYKDWKITTEEKLIDGRKCYKAIGTYSVYYKDLVFNHALVAWFCPELPYSYGPKGYGGLPGLILELKIRNAVFIASKIEIGEITDIDLRFFNKYKKIPKEELNRRIDESMGQ